jgi:hypothetical protein
MDGDTVEPHNLQRQEFCSTAVNLNKADYWADVVRRQHHDVSVESVPHYQTEKSLAQQIKISGSKAPLLILSVDNDASRLASLKVVDTLPTAGWISPGNGLSGGQVMFYAKYQDKALGVDFRDVYPNLREPEDHIPKANASCAESVPSTPQLISANQGAAWVTLCIIQLILEGKPIPQEVFFDSYALKVTPDSTYLVLPDPEDTPLPVPAVCLSEATATM